VSGPKRQAGPALRLRRRAGPACRSGHPQPDHVSEAGRL